MTTERSTYAWSEKETAFLTANAASPRGQMVPAFRKAFPKFTGSDVSILGKRYHLTNGTGVKGLDAKIASLETRLSDLRAQRVAAEKAETAKMVAKAKAATKAPAKNAVAEVLDAALAKPAKIAEKASTPVGKLAKPRTVKASPVKVTKA